MRPRSALYPSQQDAIAEIVRARQVACFMPPGEGKTAVSLTALHDLGCPRTLVLAPARVADTVWAPEAAEWEHLRDMRVLHATGDERQRIACLNDQAARVITLSYENFPWLLALLRTRDKRCIIDKFFQAIIFDELSRMKNVDSVKFRRFRSAVLRLPVRLGLTGTPVGNHLLDLWGEMYMVAGEKPLGPTKGQYVGRYFDAGARLNGRVISWKPRADAAREIAARIRPYAFTMKPTVATRFEVRPHVIEVQLPARIEEQIEEYVETLTTALESGTTLEAFSKTTAAMQARQMVSGAVYLKPPTVLGEPPPTERRWETLHGMKIQALEELVGELQGEPLLVFYWFQHERDRILAHFKGHAVELDSAARINAWNRREVEILLAHPASAGHGLNLQHGGCHQCWFTLPHSLEMYMQANGRLPRPGQKSPTIYNHLLLAGKYDHRVLNVLHRKDAVQDAVLQAMMR